MDADRFAMLLETEDEAEAHASRTGCWRRRASPSSSTASRLEPNAVAGIAFVDTAEEPARQPGGAPTGAAGADVGTVGRRKVAIYRPRSARSTAGSSWSPNSAGPSRPAAVVLHYQPKLNLAERELAGAEALVRWVHPEYGLVSPTEFVEAIEATGSIDILFSHVLNTALTQAADWLARGMRIGVAVNLSARQPARPGLRRIGGRGPAAPRRPAVAADAGDHRVVRHGPAGVSLPVLRKLHDLGIRLPWTTSAPATRRCPTCAGCRSTR